MLREFWYANFDFPIFRRIHGNKRYSLRAHHITNLRKMRTMNSSVRTKYSFFLGNESKYLIYCVEGSASE